MDAFVMIDKSESGWVFDVEAFILSLREQWPDAQIWKNTKVGRITAYAWSVPDSPGDAGLIEGFIARSGDHIDLKATPDMCVKFAFWVRRLVPPDVKVLLGDDQHPEALEVTNDDSAPALVAYFTS